MYSSSTRNTSSSSSSHPSSRKAHNDRNQQILKLLLKEPANKMCADCKTATHPRWASWNLGCFICIRCSGIHRSMGTHISRVKSVDLDSWTDEQVKSVVSWGNAKLNWFWEDGLPNDYIPDDSKIENFIRTKYEKKKWAKSGTVPDPSQIPIDGQQQEQQVPKQEQEQLSLLQSHSHNNNTHHNHHNSNHHHHHSNTSHTTHQRQVSTKQKPVPAIPIPKEENLLDLDFGLASTKSNGSVSSVSILSVQETQTSLTRSMPNLQTSSLLSDINGGSNLLQQQQNQGRSILQQQQNLNSRPDLKKSILSLYSTPTSSTGNFYPQQRQQQQQQQPYQSIVNSVTQISRPLQPQQQQQQQVNNPWNSQSSITTNGSNSRVTSKNSLDDDLFKNVWS